ncbi:1-(5-phosphoribosyl)-5-[(5-phosphoribosylamino)methylideneamino] imidazole-4-carboxamide isomerase [Thermovorax subterraneus]|nr:1-(5-phosphoribosyl)-5-[(5-phosphoribosylamino)methylideneamino] imidazole-4-carboxamide isomerase [Thermovorax subterraneus]
MEIFAAIDIMGKKAVRLYKGDKSKVKVYGNASEFATKWQDMGIKYLHLVDLDGAFEGFPKNIDTILEIRKIFKGFIQVGGGIRSIEAAKMLNDIGVDRIIVGTKALTSVDFLIRLKEMLADKLFIALDFKGNELAIKGWESSLSFDKAKDVLECIKPAGFVVTDTDLDGTLSGLQKTRIETLISNLWGRIIYSGGIRDENDVKVLLSIPRISGVIIGKALYEGTLNIKEVLSYAYQKDNPVS